MKKLRPSIFIAIFAIIIFAGGYFTTVKNKRQKITERTSELKELQNKLRKTTAVVQRKKEAVRRLEIVSEKWEQARKMLPTETSIPSILTTLTKRSGEAEVKIQHLKPLPPKQKEKYIEIPIEAQIVGSYHAIGRFMAELNNMERITKVSNLNLKSIKGKEEGEFLVEGVFTLVTYVSKGGNIEGEK